MKAKGQVLLSVVTVLLSAAVGGASGFFAVRLFPNTPPAAQTERVVIRQSDEPTASATAPTTALTAADIAERCTKSVVNIEVEEDVKDYTGGSAYSRTEISHGTGIVMREDGYIVTCYHVVQGADKITVIMDDQSEYTAELVGSDQSFDLAVIHVEANGLDAAVPCDFEELRAGEGVVIIGNPLGEFGSSVSVGVLSATEREVTVGDEPLRLLQTDAAVNPGNSGGGMFNMRGQLIGMVNAKMTATDIEGLGFAIPLNTIEEKIDLIIDDNGGGEKAVLGVGTKAAVCYLDDEKLDCVQITSVREGSAAEEGGLREGDYLLRANEKQIKSNDDLVLVVKYSRPGDEIEFTLCRNGEKQTCTVVLHKSE